MNKNQKGFSVVGIIAVVATVVLVGAVGWMYWQNMSQESTTDTGTDTSQESSSGKEPELLQPPTAPKYDPKIHPAPADTEATEE